MDKSAYNGMKKIVNRFIDNNNNKKIVDIGSYDVNGSYKSLFDPIHDYIGIDIISGPNVDIKMKNEFIIPLSINSIDVVISGSCLEHCKNPFILTKEMYRILKYNGIVILCIPQIWPVHRYPVDNWRILPDGMRELLVSSGFNLIDISTKSQLTIRHGILKMTYGIGTKK